MLHQVDSSPLLVVDKATSEQIVDIGGKEVCHQAYQNLTHYEPTGQARISLTVPRSLQLKPSLRMLMATRMRTEALGAPILISSNSDLNAFSSI